MKDISMGKAYNPVETEKKWNEIWIENGLGEPQMDHALSFFLPDIISRGKKMQGIKTLGIPGLEQARFSTHISLGNTIDPKDIIDKYGSDALRFTLAIKAVPGIEISISVNRIKGYKAFANKIWNASRYILMNLKDDEDFLIDFNKITDTDKWILNTLNNTIINVNDLMDNYKINKAADLVYHFFWHKYCDWYLEFSKSDINNLDTRKTLKFTLYRLLQLVHPFMPYISEEIFQKIKPDNNRFLLRTTFPSFSSDLVFCEEFSNVELLKKIIIKTRKTRMENKIDPNRKVNVFLKTESEKEKKIFEKNIKYFNSLTKSARTEIVTDFPLLSKGFRGACLNWSILLPFDREEDRLNELDRLKKEMEIIEKQVNSLEKKLYDESFDNIVPQTVVFNIKKNLQKNIDKLEEIRKTINDLS